MPLIIIGLCLFFARLRTPGNSFRVMFSPISWSFHRENPGGPRSIPRHSGARHEIVFLRTGPGDLCVIPSKKKCRFTLKNLQSSKGFNGLWTGTAHTHPGTPGLSNLDHPNYSIKFLAWSQYPGSQRPYVTTWSNLTVLRHSKHQHEERKISTRKTIMS